jgi:tripartite-type tricarboxylate transporter receptor subunit TctC
LALAAGCAAACPAGASPAEDFYKGRQVNMVIGFNAGGGYDIYGRLVARHIARHIPGNPNIVIRNMPGGGSLIAANHLYNAAPKDGSEVGLFAGSVATDPLIGGTPAKYDARKFVWLGSAFSDTTVCVSWHATPFKTMDDLFKREMITGSVGNSTTLIVPVAMNSVLGTKLKIVKGYQGSGGLKVAMERGEIEGFCGASLDSIQSSSPDWLTEHKINVLTQMSFKKTSEVPNVPSIMDYAKTDDDKQVLQLIFSWMLMGRPLAAPPGVPQDRVTVLRTAFDDTMKDSAFVAESNKLGITVDPVTGQDMDEFLAKVYQSPKPLIKRAADILQRGQ